MKPGWPPPKNVWKPPVRAADEQFHLATWDMYRLVYHRMSHMKRFNFTVTALKFTS